MTNFGNVIPNTILWRPVEFFGLRFLSISLTFFGIKQRVVDFSFGWVSSTEHASEKFFEMLGFSNILGCKTAIQLYTRRDGRSFLIHSKYFLFHWIFGCWRHYSQVQLDPFLFQCFSIFWFSKRSEGCLQLWTSMFSVLCRGKRLNY